MNKIFERLWEVFAPERIAEFLLGRALPSLVVAAVTFVVFYVIWRLIDRASRVALDRTQLDETARSFMLTVLKYAVLILGAITALNQLGVNMASILTSMGVAGLTIGFAARDALSNIISGLFIFWDRPFVIGDLIEVGDRYGRVQEITMRSTRVVTPDGKMLAIPNTEILNTVVASYTNFPNLRLDIDVTVGVGEDLGRVRSLLLGLVSHDDRFLADPAPQVVVMALNDYNVAVQLRAWLDNEREHVAARLELREKAFNALREAGVDMPFETVQLEPLVVEHARTAEATSAP
jgi:small conductance mechanosensitive channel